MSLRAISIGATGLDAHSTALDIVANNIANIETPGFKRSHAHFRDLVAQGLAGPIGAGTSIADASIDGAPGPLVATGRPLDVAIQGSGFFAVRDSDGQRFYSRAGNFSLDGAGRLALAGAFGSYSLDPSITIPPGTENIAINADGSIDALDNGQSRRLGVIEATTFINPDGLANVGDNLFTPSPASGEPTVSSFGSGTAGNLSAGYLEQSNVDLTNEIVGLITHQQGFGLNSEVIRAANERLQILRTLNA